MYFQLPFRTCEEQLQVLGSSKTLVTWTSIMIRNIFQIMSVTLAGQYSELPLYAAFPRSNFISCYQQLLCQLRQHLIKFFVLLLPSSSIFFLNFSIITHLTIFLSKQRNKHFNSWPIYYKTGFKIELTCLQWIYLKSSMIWLSGLFLHSHLLCWKSNKKHKRFISMFY